MHFYKPRYPAHAYSHAYSTPRRSFSHPLHVSITCEVRDRAIGNRHEAMGLARQRVYQRPPDLSQLRWVCPSPVGTRELARSGVEAAELCAGLHRHLDRRSTFTSRRDPREPPSWHRGRETVGNAWSTPHLDLVRLENRPAELAAQAHNLGLPGREPARACVLLEGVHVCRSVGTFRKRKLHTQINVVNTRAMPAGSSREDGRVLNCWNWTARVRHAVLDFTEEAAALRTRLALS